MWGKDNKNFNIMLKRLEEMSEGSMNLSCSFQPQKDSLCCKTGGLITKVFSKIHAIVHKISTASVRLSQTAPELQKAATELKSASASQAEQAVQIAAAGRELSATVENVTESTLEASRYSSEIIESAANAMEKSRNTADAMTNVKEMVNELQAQMKTMEEYSSTIGSIMEMIKKIADQTNLLSLNASIEAARAGEMGRGFAVVATEVRKLAEQSMEATDGVENILNNIRNSVKASGKSVDNVLASVDTTATVSSEAADILDKLTNDIKQLDSRLSVIAQAGKEQSDTVNSVADSIESIAAQAEQQSSLSEKLETIVADINEGCDGLLISIGEFRLKSHERSASIVEQAASSADMQSMDSSRMESYLNNFIRSNPFIELAYITDARGRQVSANIWNKDVRSENDKSSIGSDWSTRDWFKNPARTGKTYISDIYRSVASGGFCFSVAVPVKSGDGSLKGVFAVDVNFADMLNI